MIAETLLRNQEEMAAENEDTDGRPGSSSSTGHRPPSTSSADLEPFEVIDERAEGEPRYLPYIIQHSTDQYITGNFR